ncbi:hypothetical protein SDC9_194047 [bioreactor metagenome]|uniref:Uncharacterized protein n=1 Tax=bioreactor metagenome TaxID=1076179 RepID=A0A645I586_9ZZZZ
MVDRRFTAALQFIAITAKAQCGQTPLALNHLTINVINIRAVAFLSKEGLPRIRRNVIGNVQHAAVHCRHQDVNLFWRLAVFTAGLDLHGQRLVRTHFSRAFQRQLQTSVFVSQR